MSNHFPSQNHAPPCRHQTAKHLAIAGLAVFGVILAVNQFTKKPHDGPARKPHDGPARTRTLSDEETKQWFATHGALRLGLEQADIIDASKLVNDDFFIRGSAGQLLFQVRNGKQVFLRDSPTEASRFLDPKETAAWFDSPADAPFSDSLILQYKLETAKDHGEINIFADDGFSVAQIKNGEYGFLRLKR